MENPLRFKFTPRINKRNNQINISLPKRKLPKRLLDDITNIKEMDFILEDWK